MEEKRARARAFIILNGKLVLMKRKLNGKEFYVFPGGGREGNEALENCVIREVKEEFGLTVKPVKKLYVYEGERSVEHFYICDYVDGKFGTGTGEEFDKNRNNGVYKPKLVKLNKISSLPLMPPEVAKAFCDDLNDIIEGKKLKAKKLLAQNLKD